MVIWRAADRGRDARAVRRLVRDARRRPLGPQTASNSVGRTTARRRLAAPRVPKRAYGRRVNESKERAYVPPFLLPRYELHIHTYTYIHTIEEAVDFRSAELPSPPHDHAL